MALSLDNLKTAFKKQETPSNGQGKYKPSKKYPFFTILNGESVTVRFVADKNQDNPRGFLLERHEHVVEIDGKTVKATCDKVLGKSTCAMCDLAQTYYKNEDKVQGSRYYAKKKYLAQAIVVSDPLPIGDEPNPFIGTLRYLDISKQIYDSIQAELSDWEYDALPYDVVGGHDFVISKTKQGEYSSYSIGTRFKSKPRALNEAELKLVDEAVDLSSLPINKVSASQMLQLITLDANDPVPAHLTDLKIYVGPRVDTEEDDDVITQALIDKVNRKRAARE